MPRVTLDLSEARSFEPTEPGTYPMIVETAEPVKSKEGKSMLNIAFKFEDPETDQRCGLVYRNYMLAGKGAGFFRELWKALTGEELAIGEGAMYDVDTDDIIGKHVVAKITNREYEGRQQNEIGSVVAA